MVTAAQQLRSTTQVRIEPAALELLRYIAAAEDRSLTKQMTVLIKEGFALRNLSAASLPAAADAAAKGTAQGA